MFPNIVTKKHLTALHITRKKLLVPPLLISTLSRCERGLSGGDGSLDSVFITCEEGENGSTCRKWLAKGKAALDRGREGEDEEEASAIEAAKRVGDTPNEAALLDGYGIA